MATLLKKGSKSEDVKKLQKILGVTPDGVFGAVTERELKKWQASNGLVADGIAGSKTLSKMGLYDKQPTGTTTSSITINKHLLKDGEYYTNQKQVNKYIFLHHTAGADNPYAVVDCWSNDKQGHIATEFVIGGKNLSGATKYDGQIVQCFPNEKCWAYHLGISSPSDMSRTSVGIEICNYGYLTDEGKTYTKRQVAESDIVALDEKFRGYTKYHRYTDKQLESLLKLIRYIANRDNIDAHEGLYKWIKEKGKKAFDYNADAFNGKIKGVLTHANVRKDKSDCFPQPELLDMILSI